VVRMGTVQTEYHCILLNIRKQKYHSKIILSGKSGTFVKYQDISRII